MLRAFLDPGQLRRWLVATHKLENEARILEDRLPYTCAFEYTNLVRQNLVSGKFSYPTYNERYESWKKDHGFPMKFWMLKRDLLNAITIIKMPKGYLGGVDPTAIDSGGKSWFGAGDYGPKKLIVWYALLVEEGFGTYPKPRPLFIPTGIEYSDTGWIRQAEAALKRLEQQWI